MAPMTEEGKLAEHLQKMLPLLQGPSAEVVAGAAPNIATWYIPQALRIVNSEYFRTACEEPIKKGILRKIALLDCKPELFQRFVQWMYFATLPASETFRSCEAFQLWSLGEKLTASGFKDTLMTEIHVLFAFDASRPSPCFFITEEADSFLLSALASKDIGREEALDTKPLAAYLEMPKN
ncbi:hypothetical protein SNOG_08290 [Parastagonospora nodorum SN15]|uniref:BTB domain-containing protein n=1 Tax=Phaeosphaeria nodorum (strain SN15 / ATCC MYA-4574 / FGSC 10173) TaxID=321614 RepID=Q0UIX4_PHANO|nr:hypothetical protein SNOG_08290 [Parastagonospora nodorum SN15]EAT84566.2 hypothetical protein SNOG_08290 [Parastagonospora nodorum SN15]